VKSISASAPRRTLRCIIKLAADRAHLSRIDAPVEYAGPA